MDQQQTPGFLARLWLAFVAYWAVLFDPAFAAGVAALRKDPAALPAGTPKPQLPDNKATPKSDRREALHVLAMLQRDGRLIDFLQEDLSGASDEQIGVAARAVHQGCKKTIAAYLTLEPVYTDPEGASVTVEQGFDPSSVRLTGNVVGNPPFKGSLRHHGWRAKDVKLPNPPDGQDPAILAPAEVELP